MGLLENLVASAGAAVVEAYAVRGLLPQHDFRSILYIAFGVNSSLCLAWALFIYPVFFSPLRHLPRAEGHGNRFTVILESPRGKTPLRWMRTIPNDGLIRLRGLFNRDVLLATNHQALLDVMSTNTYDFEKPWKVRNFLARVIGFGLILSEGPQHQRQRKAITPSFNIKIIRASYRLMWEKTKILLEAVEKDILAHPVEGTNPSDSIGKVEMSEWASRLTLDVIGAAAMGRDFQSLTHDRNQVSDSFQVILEPSRDKIVFLALNFILPQWISRKLPLKLNGVLDTETGFLRRVCGEIVQEKRFAMSRKSAEQEPEADILGSMLQNSDFTNSELIDQMLTFLAAGHETTASALTWACYLLSLHQDVQRRLREEIRARIPSASSPITWNVLESLPLLNGVCQEVLRLYPTVPTTIREAVRDTTVAGTRIPKGTHILLCPYAINRCPLFWGATGEQFIPERWIDYGKNGEPIANRHGGASTNYAQITFLHGQRSCIGKDFSRAELRCAVAGLVGRFGFGLQDPEQEIHVAGAVTTKAVEGMHLRMYRVDGW